MQQGFILLLGSYAGLIIHRKHDATNSGIFVRNASRQDIDEQVSELRYAAADMRPER